MSYETILYEVNNQIATITLNRPDSLNAFNNQMIHETTDAFKKSERDKGVRCIVLTGNGRGFSSGQDLGDVQDRETGESIAEHLRETYHRLIIRMTNLEKPIIGAINGVTAGAGCGVALATDIRIASEKASFILAFSRIGLIPDSGTNWFLPRLIGYTRAYAMAITADRVRAPQALEWGLVNEVTPHEQLAEVTAAWADRLANGATLSFGLTKRAMQRSWGMSLSEALTYEAHLQEVASRSDDFTEGVNAFIEKRDAQFKGS